jgi:hypothetical protein
MRRLVTLLGSICLLAAGSPSGAHAADALCFPDGTQGVFANDSGLHLLANLEEAAGTRVDSSPKGNDLTPVNAPGNSTDHQQGDFSVDLSEADEQYLERASADLAPGFPGNVGGEDTFLSVGGWVKIFSAGKHPLVLKVNDTATETNQRSWSLWVWDFGSGPVFDPNVFADGANQPPGADFQGTTVLQIDEWYHFVYTYDGTTSTSNLYVNGVADAAPFQESITTFFTGTAPLDLGFRPGFGDENTYLDGLLDQVFVLDRVLSADEVAAIHQFGILPATAICGDGNACNGTESCDAVLGCQPGTPLTCDDGQACNGVESCDTTTGCVAGTAPACDDGDLCTADTCDDQVPGGCVHTPQGVPINLKPAVLFGTLNKPGKNSVGIAGTMVFPFPITPALDPIANGIAAQVLDQGGALVEAFEIPGGAKDPVTKIGWTVNKAGTTWKFTDPTAANNGVRTAQVKVKKGTGEVKALLKGKGTFGVVPGMEPVTLQVLVGSDASQCGEVAFAGPAGPAPACKFNAKATSLKCK